MNRLSQLEPSLTPLRGFTILVTPRGRACRSRLASLACALRGLQDAWARQPNLRIHVVMAAWAIALGAWCRLSPMEWLWITFAIGLVLVAELLNTAMEETVDLVVGLRPDPLAGRVKDTGAACVLVAALLAGLIGVMTFLPHVLGR